MYVPRFLRRIIILSALSLFPYHSGICSQKSEESPKVPTSQLPIISEEDLTHLRTSMGDFSNIPVDLFDRHLTQKLPAYVMCLNKAFFMLISGFKDDQICKKGIQTSPSFKVSHCLTPAKVIVLLDFNPHTISSVYWYVLVMEAVNLPQELWSFLKNSRIKTLSLRGCKIDNLKAVCLAQSLQNTCVEKIDLYWNQIDNEGARQFAENLTKSNAKEVILTKNNITPGKGTDFVRSFHEAKIRFVHLDACLEKEIAERLKTNPTMTAWKFVWDLHF